MGLKSFCLGSGSQGNSFYVESSSGVKILVDLGFSFKRIIEILDERGVDVNDIDYVFITHEHLDHCSGLGMFLKKVKKTKVYISSGTFQALKMDFSEQDMLRFVFVSEYDVLNLADLRVLVVAKSHDSKEALSFVFENCNSKVGIFTDLGFVSDEIKCILRSCDVVYIEANYSDKILSEKRDSLNYNYVARLTSDVGHLSLKECLDALESVFEQGRRVVLSHISRNTNSYERVYNRVNEVFVRNGSKGEFLVSFQDEPTPWLE